MPPAEAALGSVPDESAASGRAGLVICAISGREAPTTVPEGLLQAGFPSPELVPVVAGAFARQLPKWGGSEGPRARLVISPGSIAVARIDLAKQERTAERVRLAAHARVDADVALGHMPMVWRDRESEAGAGTRGTISEWSAKSRARMVATICALDLTRFAARGTHTPGMVTLTLPGDWLTVCPTAADWKRMVRVLRKRYVRAFGEHLDGLWKLEFQRRGAPHGHIFTLVPSAPAADGRPFRQWLSEEWADVVGHPDPEERAKHLAAGTGVDLAEGLRASDPRRVAVYFTKHSSANFGDKEYQHTVPAEWAEAGPGRFWGYWGLEKVESVVEVPTEDADRAARIMRRWARAQGTTREVSVWRSRDGRFRKVRRRVRRMPSNAGFLALNNGPAFAWQLARALDRLPEPWQHTTEVPF